MCRPVLCSPARQQMPWTLADILPAAVSQTGAHSSLRPLAARLNDDANMSIPRSISASAMVNGGTGPVTCPSDPHSQVTSPCDSASALTQRTRYPDAADAETRSFVPALQGYPAPTRIRPGSCFAASGWGPAVGPDPERRGVCQAAGVRYRSSPAPRHRSASGTPPRHPRPSGCWPRQRSPWHL